MTRDTNHDMNHDTNEQEYLARRQLKKGTAGWILLAGLGVSYVISGDFAGWNFGIAEAGWGGFAIAALLMGIMYLALVLSLAAVTASRVRPWARPAAISRALRY